MNRPRLTLILEDQALAVCRLAATDPVPPWADASPGFLSITRTSEELSIVCPSGLAPSTVKQEPGWRMFKVAGPLDFGLVGVLHSVLEPLARSGISVLSVSTFDTDYVLVKAAKVAEARQVLTSAGHVVRPD
jgi:hypothetical protein